MRRPSGWDSRARAQSRTGSSPRRARQRIDPAPRVDRGQRRRLLVHGRVYFRALTKALAAAGDGDLVLFVGWRGDGDEQLGDGGPTVVEALCAARRGALVSGLLWRAHPGVFDSSRADPPARRGRPRRRRRGAARPADPAAGQPPPEDRRPPAPGPGQQRRSYVGGIDLVLGARDDIVHRGDPQYGGANPGDEYKPAAPSHDAQVELRGPVVRDLHDVIAERWDDPAPLARLPWHVVPDLLHGLPRRGSSLPDPAPDPPRVGGVRRSEYLRTYPQRRPAPPFAPGGERSLARAFIKVLGRAQRLVYVEDQYLWSADVARVFAAALLRTGPAAAPDRPSSRVHRPTTKRPHHPASVNGQRRGDRDGPRGRR